MSALSPTPARASLHKTIFESLEELLRKAPAAKLADIARQAGKDARTVRHHLELLEASGAVVFLDAGRTVLATPATLAKTVQDLALDRAGFDNLRDVWDNDDDKFWDHV